MHKNRFLYIQNKQNMSTIGLFFYKNQGLTLFELNFPTAKSSWKL